MKSYHKFVLLVAILLASLPLGAEILIDTTFAERWTPVTTNPRATGSLPGNWRDNSEWAQVWVDYQRVTEGDRTFLRIDVKRVDDGWAQLSHSIPRVTGETYFRMSLTVRNLDGLTSTFGLRRSGSPYNWLWQTTQTYPSGWRELTYTFRADRVDYDVGIYVPLAGVGRFDLARFRLERFTREAYIEELSRGAASSLQRNLVRTSRFPLGIQSGWVIDRDSSDDENEVAPDSAVTGPSGAPALRVRTVRTIYLYSAPFPVHAALDLHTASVYARGRGTVRLNVLSEGRSVAQRTLTADPDEWRRVEAPFRVDLINKINTVRFEINGEIWLDAFQVERGAQASRYASGGAAEVSLQVDSQARVLFEDEEQKVRYAVTGETRGARLRLRLVDLYGGERDIALIPLGGEFLYAGEVDLAQLRTPFYGTFRIEAWVENDKGEAISPPNEIVVHRLRRPRYWMQDAPDSPFGTHTNSTLRHILMAKAAGINWVRLHDAGTPYIGWYHLERKPGEWTFRDEDIYRYRRNGLMVLGAFATAPEWASHFDKARNNYFDRYYQPKDWDAFARYVRTVAERYRGVILDWDLWNEPWIPGYWAVRFDESRNDYDFGPDPAGSFVRLMKTAWEAAKAVAPEVRILGVNSTTNTSAANNRIPGAQWTRSIVEKGGLEYCDIICYHQYASAELGYRGDEVETGLRNAAGAALPSGKPVWMTEGSSVAGWRTGTGFLRYSAPSESFEDVWQTSDRLVRFVAGLLAQGVEKVFLYSMHTHVYFGMGNEYRVLVGEDGYLHPSAAAHSNMAWLLEGTRWGRTVTVAEGVTAYEFAGDGYTVTLLAPRPRHAPYKLPAEGLDLFGNPVPEGAELGRYAVFLVTPGGD